MEKITHSEQETKDIGKQLASTLIGGTIIALHGDLGAGKTTFVKGIAEGLGVTNTITSPTFTIMNTYEIRNSKFEIRNLIHIDTYRLENEQELIDIGVEDYLGMPDTVCIIEWPEKIEKLLANKSVISITLEHTANEGERKLRISKA